MKFKLSLLFLLVYFAQFQSQEIEVDSVITEVEQSQLNDNWVETDSILDLNHTTDNVIIPRKFKENYRKKYQTNEFDYELIKPRESLIERIIRRIKSILENIFGDIKKNSSEVFGKFLFYFLLIIGTGVILFFLFQFIIKKEGTFLWSKKNIKKEIENGNLYENIHEIDFAKNILEYERHKNYRMAVRYYFLWVLKKLSDQEIIQWNPQKTNKDYVKEFPDNPNKPEFSKLSFFFDFVWYGEFEITENHYLEIKNSYSQFLK